MHNFEPKNFSGNVNGIDVIANPGQPVRCLAFIVADSHNEIQVATESPQLQTALELASAKNVPVNISYEERGPERMLTRVHVLDRYFPPRAGALPPLFDEQNNPYFFGLLPDATVAVSVSFMSGWVNAVKFANTLDPSESFPPWPGCSNRDTIWPKSFQYQNKGMANIPFAISYGYKNVAQDRPPGLPWGQPYRGVVKSYSHQEITLGYTDGTSLPSYDNCLITITITDGELPNGGRFRFDRK